MSVDCESDNLPPGTSAWDVDDAYGDDEPLCDLLPCETCEYADGCNLCGGADG